MCVVCAVSKTKAGRTFEDLKIAIVQALTGQHEQLLTVWMFALLRISFTYAVQPATVHLCQMTTCRAVHQMTETTSSVCMAAASLDFSCHAVALEGLI
jgi:hypothetical protein